MDQSRCFISAFLCQNNPPLLNYYFLKYCKFWLTLWAPAVVAPFSADFRLSTSQRIKKLISLLQRNTFSMQLVVWWDVHRILNDIKFNSSLYWSCYNIKKNFKYNSQRSKLLTKATVKAIKELEEYMVRGENCYCRLSILKIAAAKVLHSDIQKFKMLQVIRDSTYYGK